jgi:hypothetical protein
MGDDLQDKSRKELQELCSKSNIRTAGVKVHIQTSFSLQSIARGFAMIRGCVFSLGFLWRLLKWFGSMVTRQ